MISKLSGILRERKDHLLLIEANGIGYEVITAKAVLANLSAQGKLQLDQPIQLITYHYHQVEPSRSFPVLIGFSNEVERDFFEQFITVSGVGPRAAVRALAIPISTIAKAIDRGDIVVLKSLPGIGIQRAREIIAKLQGKVGKFALIQDEVVEQKLGHVHTDIASEAVEVLLQLQYSRQEARAMVERALERNTNLQSAEELLNEVYKQRALKPIGSH